MKRPTKAQLREKDRVDTLLLIADGNGYSRGLRDGRTAALKEWSGQADVKRDEVRGRAIDAMAHALKAMADVVEPRRI